MLGLSYGELFLLIGATAALIGPKDLPKIARTAGRLAGRSIGYVQVARGQFDSVMHQSKASEVHKELQDAMAQLDAIRYEIRSISLMSPGPVTRKLMDNTDTPSPAQGLESTPKVEDITVDSKSTLKVDAKFEAPKPAKELSSISTNLADLHSRAVTYAKLSEGATTNFVTAGADLNFDTSSGLINVLPVSAESAELLPKGNDDVKGSDIMLEAILEAEVAHSASQFFAQAEHQLPRK